MSSHKGEIACPITGQAILLTTEGDQLIPIASFGQCRECSLYCSEEALMNTGEPSTWIVEYENAYCKNCKEVEKEDKELF